MGLAAAQLQFDYDYSKHFLDQKYFFLPNHYWKHKNHMIVLEALKQLVKKNFIVISTGQTYDHRDPAYFRRFKKTIKDKNITNHYLITTLLWQLTGPINDIYNNNIRTTPGINPKIRRSDRQGRAEHSHRTTADY